MKKFLVMFFFAASCIARAQTFPVQNLQVNGISTFAGGAAFSSTSSFAGQSTFTLSPTAPTPSPGDSSLKLATTQFVSTTLAATVPFVQTNSGLQAISTLTAAQVWRLGYSSLGDVPPLLYTASLSACTLNGGNGDNGSQVKSSNNLCWIASFPPGPLDVREWGVVADGATDNTAALQAAWTYGGTVNTDILLPPSNWTNYVKFSSIFAPTGNSTVNNGSVQGPLSAIRGRGIGQTILKSTVTGTTCAITFNPPSSSYNGSGGNRALSDFQLIGTGSQVGEGICLNQITGMVLANFSVQNFSVGLLALDGLRIRIDNPQFWGNVNGIYATQTIDSYPNQWVITNPVASGQTGDTFYFTHAADIDIYGGDFENNNIANTANIGTIHMVGAPVYGNKGLSVFGGYYEINGGNADFLITQNSGDGPAAHSIYGVEEDRQTNTTFVNNAVQLQNSGAGFTTIDIRGSAFWTTGSYVPSSSRPYFGVSFPGSANYKITGYDSNYFLRNVESPWLCAPGTNCMNLPDGHIEEWGTATTSSGTPGSVTVTWPLACPTAVDSVVAQAQNGSSPEAMSITNLTVSSGGFYTAAGPAAFNWQLLCH